MTLTHREKILILILGFVIVIALYLNFLIFPKLEKLQENFMSLKEKERLVDKLQQTNESTVLDEKETTIQREMDKIESILPSQARIPEMYLDILSVANKTGIKQKSFTIQSPNFEEISLSNQEEKVKSKSNESFEQLMKIPMKHVFTGSYEQVKNYISEIQRSRRKIDIVGYQLKSTSSQRNQSQLFVTVTLQAYALAKKGEDYSKFIDYDFIKNNDYGREDPFISGIEPREREENSTKKIQNTNSNTENERSKY